MANFVETELTDRQRSELEYHRKHAQKHTDILQRSFSYEVLSKSSTRWWNPYWQMFEFLISLELKGKKILVVGCGFGEDALRLAKLGGDVYAFDLSPDLIALARQLAEREKLDVNFEAMPTEKLDYPDKFFDCIVARDILHHVDIPIAMSEIVRTSKPNAHFVINEIYSHSWTELVRRSKLVDRVLYPRMQRHIYGTTDPYLTPEERKLNEHDVALVTKPLANIDLEKHFNMLVTRIVSDRFEVVAKVDRIAMRLLQPVGRVFAGRLLIAGRIGPDH